MAKRKTKSKVKKARKNSTPRSALNLPVSHFVRESVIVYGDDAVRDAAKLMRDKQVGSVIVAEKSGGEVLGIVTEWDLIARVLASDRDIDRTSVREVMSAPLLKVDSDLRAQDALKIMINRGLRRLAVMEEGVLLGTIDEAQIVGNRKQRAASFPIVEPIKGHQCAFCNGNFATRKELLSHVEAMHKGSQYLELEDKLELQER
jgi:CBS domain-containing protein